MAICTNDNRLLTVRESETSENKKYELISYNSDDGSVSQTIALSFKPLMGHYSIDCNDKYLAMIDVLGNAHIFEYSHANRESVHDLDPTSDSLSYLQI